MQFEGSHTPKSVSVLGISGSVGQSAVQVLRKFPNNFRLHSFSVHSNVQVAKDFIEEFHPKFVVVTGDVSRSVLQSSYLDTKILYGMDSLCSLMEDPDIDTVVTAIVGAAGVEPTISAIKSGKAIAIANKETLVTCGDLIQSLLKKYDGKLVPVDSEHNALFQLLEGKKKSEVKSLTLTASGGSFRDRPLDSLPNVSIEEALNHPTWSMGPKITIDSAGMVNKGLEVIEAHYLFGMDYSDIQVVIHPQSIIHGLIELQDGAYLAYASYPDMVFPVAHSLFYPEAVPEVIRTYRPWEWKNLEFWEPDPKRYPALSLAFAAGRSGGTAPCIFNASNEEAVKQFLNGKIAFLDIPMLIESALGKIPVRHPETWEEYEETDREARSFVLEETKKKVTHIC